MEESTMKKTLTTLLLTMILACMLIGCGKTKISEEPVLGTDLVCVPECEYLVYSHTTGTVYYMFRHGYAGFLAEFISNGHYCEYIDGQVCEVFNGEILAVVNIAPAADNYPPV